MEDGSAILTLADAVGIERRYWDIHGTLHEISPETLKTLLGALGNDAENDCAAADSLHRLAEAEGRRLLPPVAVIGERGTVPLRSQGGDRVRWSLHLETGETFEGEARIDGMARETDAFGPLVRLNLPSLPLGYHDFMVECGNASGSTKLIVAPPRCFLPASFAHGRSFGIAAQLYALRGRGDFGVGDFGALRTLTDRCADLHVDAVGLNPLHALFLDAPEDASPYSPSSRLFRNPLYLDIAAIPEFVASDAARSLLEAHGAALEDLRARPIVDYAGVAKIKLELLECLFREFCAGEEGARFQDFRRFVGAKGLDLENFAAFQAFSEHFSTHDWSIWPEVYRRPEAQGALDLRRRYSGRIAFFQYLQWLCEEQFAAAAEDARAKGLKIGLYNDLAISVNGASSDHWSNQDLFAGNLRIGSPPDPFNEAGQEWGVVPMKPGMLRQTGYAHFIALLRAGMRHAGALRIDHVMGWQRLFLIPAGEKPAAGAYVNYPLHDFIRIAALESQRHQCLLIGEDLGTVPDGFREKMAEANILSCKIFYFERENGTFRRPDRFPPLAAVSVSTHDLATLRGYLDGDDLDTKARIGMLGAGGIEEARRQRLDEKRQMMWALAEASLLPEGIDPNDTGRGWDEALARALQVYLSRGPSKLFLAQADDILAVAHQANLPGSITEYPNWRRRHPRTLEDAFADERVRDTVAAIAAARK